MSPLTRALLAGLLLAGCGGRDQQTVLRLFPEGSPEDHAICASVLVITTAIARGDLPAPTDDRIATAGLHVLEASPDIDRSLAVGDRLLSLPESQVIPFVVYAQPVCSERYPAFFADLGLTGGA